MLILIIWYFLPVINQSRDKENRKKEIRGKKCEDKQTHTAHRELRTDRRTERHTKRERR